MRLHKLSWTILAGVVVLVFSGTRFVSAAPSYNVTDQVLFQETILPTILVY